MHSVRFIERFWPPVTAALYGLPGKLSGHVPRRVGVTCGGRQKERLRTGGTERGLFVECSVLIMPYTVCHDSHMGWNRN